MANFFWIHGAGNANWNTSGNWSATSGGSSNASTPSATSDVTFDGAGANGNTASTMNVNLTILSLTFTTGYTSTLTISNLSTLSIAGNFTDQTTHAWTVSSTGLSFTATCAITCNGKTFPGPVSLSGSATTKTITTDWTVTGTLTIAGAVSINTSKITCGGLTANGTLDGTGSLALTGGIWNGGSAMRVNLTITGTVSITTAFFSTATLTCTSGTVTASGTLTIAGASTLDTSAISWNNIVISVSGTLTINSMLTVTGTMTINTAIATVFAGTTGFNVATLTCSHTLATTVTFKNGITYTITTALNAFQSRNSAFMTLASDDATLKAILTLQNPSSCNVCANINRLDCSGGRTLTTWNGVVTGCTNVVSFTDYNSIAA